MPSFNTELITKQSSLCERDFCLLQRQHAKINRNEMYIITGNNFITAKQLYIQTTLTVQINSSTNIQLILFPFAFYFHLSHKNYINPGRLLQINGDRCASCGFTVLF